MARTKRNQGLHDLYKFLASRFSEIDLRSTAQRFGVEQAIPGKTVAIDQLAQELVDTLEKRGVLDGDFFDALTEERPRLSQEIETIAAGLSITSNTQKEAGTSPKGTKKRTKRPVSSKKHQIQLSLRELRSTCAAGAYYDDWNSTVAVWANEWRHWMKENLAPDHYNEWQQAIKRPKGSFLKSSVDTLDERYNGLEALLTGLAKVYK